MKAPDAFRTISEVAQDLDLPQHVLRFWETRFNQIKPMKRGGGRRYYRPEDVDLLRGIRLLLYAEGFTIRGVQRLLKENGLGFVVGVGQSGSVQAAKDAPRPMAEEEAEFAVPDEVMRCPSPGPREESLPRTEISAAMGPKQAVVATRQEPGRITDAFSLSQQGRRRIEAALADLLEAKRLLDTVR